MSSKTMKKAMALALFAATSAALGCKDEGKTAPAPSAPNTPAGAGAPKAGGHENEAAHNPVPIGEQTVGELKLAASQDEPVTPGGEGAFDLKITGGKPRAVRFWVGTETADGSVKAKAEEESPGNWHTHVEVPKPLPAGSKLWAEVEPPTGAAFKVSFEIKAR